MPKTTMDEEMALIEKRVNDGNYRAYYYSFYSTGNHDIDMILAAVAAAGKGYHHTEGWDDDEYGPSYIDTIQEAANRAAAKMTANPPAP